MRIPTAFVTAALLVRSNGARSCSLMLIVFASICLDAAEGPVGQTAEGARSALTFHRATFRNGLPYAVVITLSDGVAKPVSINLDASGSAERDWAGTLGLPIEYLVKRQGVDQDAAEIHASSGTITGFATGSRLSVAITREGKVVTRVDGP